MSAGLPSDEVADDYKNSLEDLVTNDRYQIGNLTVIAKENIEHGEAIARVLENHIQRVGTNFFRSSDIQHFISPSSCKDCAGRRIFSNVLFEYPHVSHLSNGE